MLFNVNPAKKVIHYVYWDRMWILVIVQMIMIVVTHGLIEQVNPFSFDLNNEFNLGSDVGVQRGCISPETAEYKMIKEMLEEKDNACFKRANGLDCFKLCSNDKCN